LTQHYLLADLILIVCYYVDKYSLISKFANNRLPHKVSLSLKKTPHWMFVRNSYVIGTCLIVFILIARPVVTLIAFFPLSDTW